MYSSSMVIWVTAATGCWWVTQSFWKELALQGILYGIDMISYNKKELEYTGVE